jgi:hypothetical protein
LENYRVTLAEKIMPAADLSQVSFLRYFVWVWVLIFFLVTLSANFNGRYRSLWHR